ncbi:MAG: hypothetical protein ACOC00_03980 [Halothiobacillaceae bacterium]
MDAATVGALVGGLIGLAGGIYGSLKSITSTRGPRERRLMWQLVVIFWLVGIAFLAGMLWVANPWRHLLWLPWLLFLPLFIVLGNRLLVRVRLEDTSSSKGAVRDT